MSSQQKLVGVFHQESDAAGEPDFYVTRAEARELKKLDQAFFINHGNDVRLLEKLETSADLQAFEDETGTRFVNPVQSRKIAGPSVPEKNGSMDNVIDSVTRDRRGKLRPYIHARLLMETERMKPYAVMAAEAWA